VVLLTGVVTFRTKRPAPLPLTDELRAIPVPVLALLGERSPLLHPKRAKRRVDELIPQGYADILAGVGHGPGFEQGSDVNDRLRTFVTAHDTSANSMERP
jgi:pimeloyl-ACP methyl ester carboxylesterase